MTLKEIIDGLKFTIDMFLFDPTTGETLTEPRNDMDKTTIDACKGAIELLEQAQWIPVSEKTPPNEEKSYWICTEGGYQCQCRWTNTNHVFTYLTSDWHWHIMDIPQYDKVVAWMQLPEQYKEVRNDD